MLLPWVLADAWLWRGIEHGAGEIAALTAGSLAEAALFLLLAAAVAGVSATGTQMVLWLFGVAALFVATEVGLSELFEMGRRHWTVSGWPGILVRFLPTALTLLLLAAAWAVQTLTRRRAAAVSLLVAAVVLTAGWMEWASTFWLRPAELPYADASGLKIITGPLDPAAAGAPQSFWPGLHLAGLPPDHLATVIRLAPAGMTQDHIHRGLTGPGKPACWSDYSSDTHDWLRQAQMRNVLMRGRYAPGDLWLDLFHNHSVRGPMRKVAGTEPPDRPWNLIVGVHALRSVLEAPLAECRSATIVGLPRGCQIRVHSLEDLGSQFTLRFDWLRQTTELYPEAPAMLLEGDPVVRHEFHGLIVLRDPEARENSVLLNNNTVNFSRSGSAFASDRVRKSTLYFSKPAGLMKLTGLKLEDWLERVRLQVWVAEERGSAEFQLSAADMQRVLAAEAR